MGFIDLDHNTDNFGPFEQDEGNFWSQIYKEYFLGYEFFFCEETKLLLEVRLSVS